MQSPEAQLLFDVQAVPIAPLPLPPPLPPPEPPPLPSVQTPFEQTWPVAHCAFDEQTGTPLPLLQAARNRLTSTEPSCHCRIVILGPRRSAA